MKDDSNNIFSIENITEHQLRLIGKALDVYCRLGLLQLEEVLVDEIKYSPNFNLFDNRDVIDQNIRTIRHLLVQTDKCKTELGINTTGVWNLGIGHKLVHDNTNLCYEMSKDINHTIWKVKDGETLNVNSDRGLKITKHDRIVVKHMSEREYKINKIVKKLI